MGTGADDVSGTASLLRPGGLMEIVRKASITTLSNSGVQSEQLLFPENSSSRRVTITRVTVQPGSINPPSISHRASGEFPRGLLQGLEQGGACESGHAKPLHSLMKARFPAA